MEADHKSRSDAIEQSTAHGPLTQQSQASLYALREEYCTKLEKLVESNAEERSEAKGRQMSLR